MVKDYCSAGLVIKSSRVGRQQTEIYEGVTHANT